ncbi:MAG: hypothetical protein AAGF99_19235, partial [Bacteroidota bacterium]
MAWLRRSAAAGTLTLAMLHGAPDAAAQVASNASGDEFPVNTFTTRDQGEPSVAMDADGDFVIAWSSYAQDDPSDNYATGVYARRYNADGSDPATNAG